MSETQVPAINSSDLFSGYGAPELKIFIRQYTVKGFIYTVILTVIALLIYFGAMKLSETSNTKAKMAPLVKLKLENVQMEENQQDTPPPPTEQIINNGPAARAGSPVPVPDAQITPDMQDFATIDVVSRASSEGGTGVDLGTMASNINFDDNTKVNVQEREKEPEPDEFIPVEKEPAVDLAKLQAKIVYPELARRAGVEGKVTLRVLVGADGKVRKSLIEASDNDLLNKSALEAIRSYGNIPPAIQNGQPVTCWVSIPIQFRLR